VGVLQHQLGLADPTQSVNGGDLHHRRLPASRQPLVELLQEDAAAREIRVAGRQIGDLNTVPWEPRRGLPGLIVRERRLAGRLAAPAFDLGQQPRSGLLTRQADQVDVDLGA